MSRDHEHVLICPDCDKTPTELGYTLSSDIKPDIEQERRDQLYEITGSDIGGDMFEQILTLINKAETRARIDQMEYVNQRLIGKNTGGDRVFYDKDAVIAENHLKDHQRIIYQAMVTELKATLTKEGNE